MGMSWLTYRSQQQEIFEECKRLKKGEQEPSAALKELAEWFSTEFGLSVLYFRSGRRDKPSRKRYWLRVYLDTNERGGFYHPVLYQTEWPYKKKEDVEKKIAAKFKDIALKHDFLMDKRVKNISVTFSEFWMDAVKEVVDKVDSTAFFDKIKSKNRQIWKIMNSTIFYFLDCQIEENWENGRNQKILDRYYKELKRFDEFGLITRENLGFGLKFYSKEGLDEHYEGRWDYYFR